MKTKLFIPLLLILLMSCEEVIKVDLKDNSPAIVAEGLLYNDSLCAVKITTTSNYYAVGNSTYVDDAVVVVKKDDHDAEKLTYSGNGYYIGNSIHGVEGGNYQIEISHRNNYYRANSYMPPRTQIYDIAAVKKKCKKKGGKMYKLEVKWRDNPNMQEYYMLKYFVNGKPLDHRYRIVPDVIAMGDTLKFSSMLTSFKSGDHVEVVVYSVDKSVFTYFKQLNDVMGGIVIHVPLD